MKHRARKRFGQNFLVDESMVAAIVAAIYPQAGDHIIEIGPGLGALTQPLLMSGANIQAIEIDRDLGAALQRDYPQLVVHICDALTLDYAQFGEKLRIVGNLPYNISSPLLFQFERFALRLRDAHVMLQKEVVDRMVAAAGESDYGRLSVMLQYRFGLEKLFEVGADAFHPQPQVESALVRLVPHRPLPWPALDEALFAQLVTAAFSQRRKTLRNSLEKYLTPADFDALNLNPQLRAQDLSAARFVALSNHLRMRDA